MYITSQSASVVQLVVNKASVGQGKVWLRYVAELQVPSVESFIRFGFVLSQATLSVRDLGSFIGGKMILSNEVSHITT